MSSRRPATVPPAPAPSSEAARSLAELPPVTLSEYDGVRYLHLGSVWVQGAMRIRKPDAVELDYVQRMLASLLWLPTARLEHPASLHAVQLGLGSAAVTRFMHRQLRVRTTAVELNPQVVTAARLWFHLGDDDALLRVQRDDALRWLQTDGQPGSADLLHVDLYDHEAAAPVLDDEAFYGRCRALLAPGGTMSVNLFGRHASYAASAARIAAVFGADQVWSLRPTREGNTVVVAGQGVVVPGRDELLSRAAWIEQRFGALGLKARQWLRMVRPYRPSSPA